MQRARPLVLVTVIALLASLGVAPPTTRAVGPVSFTILHTNDFHGQLEPSGSNPGMARVSAVVNDVKTAVGAANVLLVDPGDEMQGSLLSNLGDGTATGKGLPTIATYNAMGYAVATFGNHEFDWGQPNLAARTAQAAYPYVTANIVKNDTGSCATAGWTKPDFAANPYEVKTVNGVKVAFIGVTTTETPTITVSTATAGLCFKDPAESILHYYDAMKAAADVVVVLSHLGYADGGYGYGIPVYGDQSLAAKLNTAGKPANLIIGGHSHTNLSAATVVGSTPVVQAYYNGRRVGRADFTFDPASKAVTVAWQSLAVSTTGPEDPAVKAVIATYATDPAYVALVNTPVGYSAVDLGRSNTGDNMMGTFIDDAIYSFLNTDAEPTNDVDVFFNNAGGIRTDWCYVGGAWASTGCAAGTHAAGLLTYGNMFTVLPFGNATAVGTMTGAQILEVLNYGPNVAGVIQPAGLKYKYYSYKDANPGPQPYAWGAFDACVVNKTTKACEPLDLKKTYKVGTNEFLAPAGGDGYNGFKYMKNITYWGDMLNAVNAYVAANYGTPATAYKGPNGDGTLDGRITRDGTDAGGSIVPVTILHHNDSHGNLAKGAFVGYTQLATLIKQEKLHNPTRTLLLSGGDNIQGDAMSYYFKSAPLGYAADGTALPAALQKQPLIAAFNAMGYDAMDLGNHEFNFGSAIFTSVLKQATFPILGANVTDTGAYGLAERRREAVPREDRRCRGDQGRDPGHHQPPRPELRAAEQHPGPHLQRPDRQGPGARHRPRDEGRRGRRAHAHRVHRGPEERRGRQERRHEHGHGRDRARRDHRLPQPHQPGDRVRRLQVPADDRRRPEQHPGRHQPGLSLQQHARRGRPRHAGQGRRGLRRGLPDRALPERRHGDRRGCGHQGDRRSVRGGPGRLQRQGHRQDDGPDRHHEGLHRGDERRQPPGRRRRLRACEARHRRPTSTCRAR